MKHLIIITALLSATLSFAETQTKRPSWSQGLPERQTIQPPGNPGFEPEQSEPSIQSQPTIKAERPITPDIEIDITTQPELELKVSPEVIEQPQVEPVRRAGYRRLSNRSVENKDDDQLYKQYNWSPIKTVPINIPPRHATKNELKVRIYINPDGRVVRVAAGAPDVPAMMLKQAQQSIQQWQFEPPKDIGITDNIAKTFTIEIKTG